MFLCLKHGSFLSNPSSHLLLEAIAAEWLLQRGTSYLFAGVQEASVVWGQSNDGDVSPLQHQELLEAKGKGINFNKHALCASPGVKAPYCYCTFSPNIPAEKLLWLHT